MEKQTFMSGLGLEQQLMTMIVDALVLVELCVSMYLASRHPDQFTSVFFTSFFVMLLPTVIAGYTAIRVSQKKRGTRP